MILVLLLLWLLLVLFFFLFLFLFLFSLFLVSFLSLVSFFLFFCLFSCLFFWRREHFKSIEHFDDAGPSVVMASPSSFSSLLLSLSLSSLLSLSCLFLSIFCLFFVFFLLNLINNNYFSNHSIIFDHSFLGMLQNGMSRELFEKWCTRKQNGGSLSFIHFFFEFFMIFSIFFFFYSIKSSFFFINSFKTWFIFSFSLLFSSSLFSIVVIPGYCVEGTLAKHVMSEPETITTMSGLDSLSLSSLSLLFLSSFSLLFLSSLSLFSLISFHL